VISGVGAAVPGTDSVEQLLDAAPPPATEGWAVEPRIGRKGWRYKDRATRLALAAAREALHAAGPPPVPDAARTGVVASSNLGNLDTVCRVAAQLKAGRSSDTSPMDLPNASSNVVASTIAQWFGLKGANLMLCNGATSGIDALFVGATLIRSGRADRVVVVGVEPRTGSAEAFMRESARQWLGESDQLQWGEAAAAVVLDGYTPLDNGMPCNGVRLGKFHTSRADGLHQSIRTIGSTPPALWLTPSFQYGPTREAVHQALTGWDDRTPEMRDIAATFGETYGACGVLQAVVAALWLRRTRTGWAALTSGGFAGDPFASCALHFRSPAEVV
jgi:3-oxoacyl-[acyl-carrier-protein] synthase II